MMRHDHGTTKGAQVACCLLAGSLLQGCLIASPPDLSDPERTRPFIQYLKVDPPLGEPIPVVASDTSIREYPILLPFQSEDLGEDVAARLHLVRENGSVRLEDTSARIPAAEFDTVRNAHMTWDATERAPGCYRLTATIAHVSSFGEKGLIVEGREDDAESVSWIAHVSDDAETPVALDRCPAVPDTL